MSKKKTINAGVTVRACFFISAVLLFSISCLVVFREKEDQAKWQRYQAQYNRQYSSLLSARIKAAKDAGKAGELKKLEKQKADHERESDIKVRAVFLPDAGVRDLCMSCHMAVNNPMFADGREPLKTHPAKILEHHKTSRYGCTMCHHGQGVGLDEKKAHGMEENWDAPRIPMQYIQSSCFGCHETVFGLDGAGKAAEGKSLFVEMGCYGCHDANVPSGLPKFSTPFSGIARKIGSVNWVAKWIEDPVSIRPGTLMPKFRIEKQDISDISAYIYSLKDKSLRIPHVKKRGNARAGKKVFTDKGCIACHSPERGKQGITRRVPVLSDAGLKLRTDWVYKWIGDPKSIDPNTWMPKLDLTKDDIANLTAYLSVLRDSKVKKDLASFKMAKADREKGRSLVQSLGCLGCHTIKGKDDPAKVGVPVGDVAVKRMDELPFGNSDVPYTKWDWIKNKIKKPVIYQTSDMPMYMPDYTMSDEQVDRLTIFYLYNRLLDLPEKYIVRASEKDRANERGDWMIRHYNCKGCHEIFAGEKPRIDGLLAKKSKVPPRIVNEVEKTQPKWLFGYLRRPEPLRPWLDIRMPMFGFTYKELQDLVQHFYCIMPKKSRAVASIPYEPPMVKSDYDPEEIEMGKYQFRQSKCMQCHPVSFTGKLPEGKNLEDLSINLMLAKSRLRFNWIKNFMRDPNSYAGVGTKMPYVFYTPDGVPRMPDPEEWLQRTALFLMFMDKVPEPIKEEEKTRQVQTFDFDNY